MRVLRPLSDPGLFHNPKAASEICCHQVGHEASEYAEHVLFVLARETQNYDASMVGRRIRIDVREVRVERYENAMLGPTDSRDVRIRMSAELLLEHGRHVEPP
jgi:hypothetical protein